MVSSRLRGRRGRHGRSPNLDRIDLSRIAATRRRGDTHVAIHAVDMNLDPPTVIQVCRRDSNIRYLRREVSGGNAAIIRAVAIAPVKDAPGPRGGPGVWIGIAQIDDHPIQADTAIATDRIQKFIEDQRADLGWPSQVQDHSRVAQDVIVQAIWRAGVDCRGHRGIGAGWGRGECGGGRRGECRSRRRGIGVGGSGGGSERRRGGGCRGMSGSGCRGRRQRGGRSTCRG